jgi:RNA recognition motif-containing protein
MVGNLSPKTTSEEIRDFHPKSFAFIEMNSLEAAYKAKEKLRKRIAREKAECEGAQPKLDGNQRLSSI